MKIGILTYHRAHNYGAVLQAYALKTFLNKKGVKNVYFVDYWPEYHKDVYRLFRRNYYKQLFLVRKIKYIIGFFLHLFNSIKKNKAFSIFIDNFLEPKEKPEANYDIVIYGSDQIWRYQDFPGIHGYNPIYFASEDIKAHYRIAYSASMGIIHDTDESRVFLSKALKNFDFIGVREKDLFDYIKPFVSCPLLQTIDPVFLLNKDEWLKILPPNPVKEKYILMLQWQKEADLIPSAAKKISEETGLKLIKIFGYVSAGIGPLDFLSLICHAEFVLSSSFHGVAFSIIFNRPFFAFLRSNQNRVVSLLNSLGLQKQFITSIDQISINKRIDWSIVNQKIRVSKESSESFLLSSIQYCIKKQQ